MFILVQITSMLMKHICWSFPLTTLQGALLCASCSHLWVQELGFSQLKLVQSAHFKHSQLSGQSQDRWDQEPLKCVQRGCQPLLSFTSQILLLCHVSIVSLCCHSSLEGNMCTTPSFPVVHPCLGVRQELGASLQGLIRWGKSTEGSLSSQDNRRQVLSF